MIRESGIIETTVSLKHGGGGRAMRALIGEVMTRRFAKAPFEGIGLAAMDDGAAIRVGDRWLIMTTDSHVIHPIFFPGGDIGRLAVSGTLNDLAMMGATESLALTCAIVIEEGFPISHLEKIESSMWEACQEAGAIVVTGDTKVMGKGELDGIIINTTGIGFAECPIRDSGLRAGDRIIVTGAVGDHGLAIMASRHGLALEGELKSDTAPITSLIARAIATVGDGIVAMKDPTRGGIASALHEMAEKSGVGIVLEETAIPIHAAVRSTGELLGIDPLQVANEGKALIGVRPELADVLLELLREHPLGEEAEIIGTATTDRPGRVILDTGFGRRFLTESDGEPLPRIC